MKKVFSIILFTIAAFFSATMAQETDAALPADTEALAETLGISQDSAAVLKAKIDSAQADQAFNDFLNAPLTTEDRAAVDSTKQSSSSSAEESSSSGEGGIVLYDAQSSSSERRKYTNDAPIYRFMATAGLRSPSRGIFSLEYIVAQEIFNIGVHFTDYDDDYFQFGANAIYYPMETRYFYTFLNSEWFHGNYDKEHRVNGKYEEYNESVNYWRVVIGIGGEALFMEHFGAYVEAGFEFFAGNGGYYLHCGKKNGNLDNDTFKLPYGIGLLFPF